MLTNADLEKIVDTTDEWITSRTGIRERHIAADGETTGDLAFHAAQRALEAAGIKASELDADRARHDHARPDLSLDRLPGAAPAGRERLRGVRRQRRLLAASSTRWALPTSSSAAAQSKKALVIGAETLSRMIDWTDREYLRAVRRRRRCGGAGGRQTSRASIATLLHADGGYKDLLYNPVGVSRGFKDDGRPRRHAS